MCKFKVYNMYTFIYCNMIVTIALANTSIMSHIITSYWAWEQLRSSLLATLEFTVLLPIITMHCISSSGLIYLLVSSLYA